MDLIYTDKNGIELGFLQNDAEIDIDIGDKNDFQITINLDDNNLDYDYRFYNESSEYGGIIKCRKVNTANKKIYYSGFTWRGMLSKKIIKPLSGNNYYVVNGNSNDIINSLIQYCSLGELFKVDLNTPGVNISYQFYRYTDLLSGLINMLKTVNYRLSINYKDGYVYLKAVKINDYSQELEFSQDGNINFSIEDNRDYVNHLICLGKGELSQRQVLDLYVQADGSISKTQYFKGIYEVAEIYDYPNAESVEELELSGIEKLKEKLKSTKMEMKIKDIDVELGDIVGGREYVTDTLIKKSVTQKIVQINNGISNISYKVGD